MVVHFNFLSGYNWTHHPLDQADVPFKNSLFAPAATGVTRKTWALSDDFLGAEMISASILASTTFHLAAHFAPILKPLLYPSTLLQRSTGFSITVVDTGQLRWDF